MKVWTTIPGTCKTGYVDIEIGQEVTVYRCSSGMSVFGERATLTRTTSRHLIFTTESGSEIKTAIDNLFRIPARMGEWNVTLKKFEEFGDHIHKTRVCYWNDKKICMEYK